MSDIVSQNKGGRPRKTAGEALTFHLGVRLTERERSALEALVARQQAALEAAGVLVAGVATPADYIRGLLRREALAAGLLGSTSPVAPAPAPPPPPPAAPAPAPLASPTPAPAPSRPSASPDDEEDLRRRARAYLDRGATQKELAGLIGWGNTDKRGRLISDWLGCRKSMPAAPRAALVKVLAKVGL